MLFVEANLKTIETLEGEDLHKFLSKLEKAELNAVIFSIINPFAEKKASKITNNLPPS